MMKGDQGPTKLLHALTCGAFDHVFHVPQVRAGNNSLQCTLHNSPSFWHSFKNSNNRHNHDLIFIRQ